MPAAKATILASGDGDAIVRAVCTVLTALVWGAEIYPELRELLPSRADGAVDCPICLQHPAFGGGMVKCPKCAGMGWLHETDDDHGTSGA